MYAEVYSSTPSADHSCPPKRYQRQGDHFRAYLFRHIFVVASSDFRRLANCAQTFTGIIPHARDGPYRGGRFTSARKTRSNGHVPLPNGL